MKWNSWCLRHFFRPPCGSGRYERVVVEYLYNFLNKLSRKIPKFIPCKNSTSTLSWQSSRVYCGAKPKKKNRAWAPESTREILRKYKYSYWCRKFIAGTMNEKSLLVNAGWNGSRKERERERERLKMLHACVEAQSPLCQHVISNTGILRLRGWLSPQMHSNM